MDIQNAGRRQHAVGVMLTTGWVGVDEQLGGGLSFGATHEWLGIACAQPQRSHQWTPALGVLSHLALQGMAAEQDGHGGTTRWGIWIGRAVHPYAPALVGHRASLLQRMLFIDPPDLGARLWAIDVALRCPGVVVIADASRLDMPASRRLQLAAEQGGSIALLARPPDEASRLSAAMTRWSVERVAGTGACQRWSVSLLRGKGSLAAGATGRMWMLERANDRRVVAVSPDVSDRSRATARAG